MNRKVIIPEKIKNSLVELQNFCNNSVDCSECPLKIVKTDECFLISETPNNWNLSKRN